MNYTNRGKAKKLTKISLFIALIILQTWIPMLGNIPLPIFPVTYIHVTVIVSAIWLGWRAGGLVGFAWGLNSMLRAYISGNPFSFAVFTSPLISVIPRLLMGILVGLLYQALSKTKWNEGLKMSLTGAVGALLNTSLVLTAIVLFKQASFITQYDVGQMSLWKALAGIIVINGFPEVIVGAVLTPMIGKALIKSQSK